MYIDKLPVIIIPTKYIYKTFSLKQGNDMNIGAIYLTMLVSLKYASIIKIKGVFKKGGSTL